MYTVLKTWQTISKKEICFTKTPMYSSIVDFINNTEKQRNKLYSAYNIEYLSKRKYTWKYMTLAICI